MSIREELIIDNAIKAFKKSFDITARRYKQIDVNADYELDIDFKIRNETFLKTYFVEVKKPTPPVIGQLIFKKELYGNNQLLIADYIPPTVAEKLRESKICFLDTNGNAFFDEPEFYIYISSKKRETEINLPKPSVIFQPAGLQILFVLLSIPNSENYTQRELAELSGVSLGAVNEIVNNLLSEYFLVRDNNLRLLVRKKELFKRWVESYSETLRRKVTAGHFRLNSEIKLTECNLKPTSSCWSGEVAADSMTNYIHPSHFTLYSKAPTIKVVQQFKLRREPKGEIEILKRFWNFNENDTVAPPLLVYADLLSSGNPRNLEVAQIIYEQYLTAIIE